MLIQVLWQVWEACLDLQPRPAFLAHTGDILTSKYLLVISVLFVTSGEAQVEKRVGKCAAQVNIHSEHTWAPASPSLLRCPGPSGPSSYHYLENSMVVGLLLTFTQVDIYSACSVCPLVLSLQCCVCRVCIQIVQGKGQYVISVGVFSLPVIFHCLTESQFIYPFSLDHFPILF